MLHSHATAWSQDVRPGFAKRASNFDEVRSQASAWTWTETLTVARLIQAVTLGTPTLPAPVRATLLILVTHLNQQRLSRGDARVWPGSDLVCGYAGAGKSTIRAHRARLEAAGFLVRDYNHANRPTYQEAFDLGPLVARLAELEAEAEAVRGAVRARRDLQGSSTLQEQSISAQALDYERLEQSHLNPDNSVREKDAPTARHNTSSRRAEPADTGNASALSPESSATRKDLAKSSPERARHSRPALTGRSVEAESLRKELRAAVQACERLRPLVPPGLLEGLDPSPAEIGEFVRSAAQLLPDPERNNANTLEWGWRNHGPRVIAILAVALEDSSVKDPCRYFGALASRSPAEVANLLPNFMRIFRDPSRSTILSTMSSLAGPGADDPIWLSIAKHLKAIVGVGAFGSWFTRVGFHGIDDGVITLSAPATAADRIKADHRGNIIAACRAAGAEVKSVVVEARRTH